MLFFIVLECPTLTSPKNGMVGCSLGGDELANPGDTCSYTCNTDIYELSGSYTRTCQIDGSWSGSDPVCKRSEYIASCILHNISYQDFIYVCNCDWI